jgi:hypothetical protein
VSKVNLPTYDVFSGSDDSDAVWICSVETMWGAKLQIEKQKPGKYFVYSIAEQTIVTRIDTTDKAKNQAAGG